VPSAAEAREAAISLLATASSREAPDASAIDRSSHDVARVAIFVKEHLGKRCYSCGKQGSDCDMQSCATIQALRMGKGLLCYQCGQPHPLVVHPSQKQDPTAYQRVADAARANGCFTVLRDKGRSPPDPCRICMLAQKGGFPGYTSASWHSSGPHKGAGGGECASKGTLRIMLARVSLDPALRAEFARAFPSAPPLGEKPSAAERLSWFSWIVDGEAVVSGGSEAPRVQRAVVVLCWWIARWIKANEGGRGGGSGSWGVRR
jgi:hypothetical protein